jgi:flavin-dependent dehydrogenase
VAGGQLKPHRHCHSHCQIAIVGGGPAGCCAALTLRRWLPELSVLLVTRPDPVGTARVGETLTPGVLPLLQFLQLQTSFEAQQYLQAGGTASAWGRDEALHRPYLFTGMGPGWQIDRSGFDHWLLAQAQAAGTPVLQAQQVTLAGKEAPFTLHLDGQPITADFLIDTTGRSARIARACGAEVHRHDALVAQARWFQIPNAPQHASEGALIASVPDGWWYTAALPQGRGVLMLMTDTTVLPPSAVEREALWQRSLAAAPAVAQRVQSWRATGEQQTRSAGSQQLDAVCGPGWVAAGDAAMAFDPLASLGIGFAISTGIEAARAAAAALEGDAAPAAAYADALRQVGVDYRSRLAAYYQMEHRWDTPFWRARRSKS